MGPCGFRSAGLARHLGNINLEVIVGGTILKGEWTYQRDRFIPRNLLSGFTTVQIIAQEDKS